MADAYQAAREYLAALDPDWQRHIAEVGPCLHQPHPARDPYESLVRAIAYQQLHAKAGDAIFGRLVGLFAGQTFPRPEQILATEFDRMRGCGFSASKIATIQGIAQATLDGVVPDYATALAMDDEFLPVECGRLEFKSQARCEVHALRQVRRQRPQDQMVQPWGLSPIS